ncbi:MAG: AAA family ATPase, partial [Pseudomonadota bacterium]
MGDTRQMTAVERGDALRLLEEKAGLVPAELKHIRRQKDPVYRQVVEQLADGKAEKGLEEADKAGFVHEVETDDGPQFVADWVVEQRKQGSVIVMCLPCTPKAAKPVTPCAARCRRKAASEKLIAVADDRGQVHLHRQMEEDGIEKMARIEEGLHPQAFAVYRQATIPVAV